MNDDIPVCRGDEKEDAKMAAQLLGELPSIGQSIGKLQLACSRCRSTTSPLFCKYEAKLTEFENRQSEIISFVRMALRQ